MSKTAGFVAVGCFAIAFQVAYIGDHPKPNVVITPPLAPITRTVPTTTPTIPTCCGTDSDLVPDTYAPGYTPPPALPPVPHMGGEVGKIPLGERLV